MSKHHNQVVIGPLLVSVAGAGQGARGGQHPQRRREGRGEGPAWGSAHNPLLGPGLGLSASVTWPCPHQGLAFSQLVLSKGLSFHLRAGLSLSGCAVG